MPGKKRPTASRRSKPPKKLSDDTVLKALATEAANQELTTAKDEEPSRNAELRQMNNDVMNLFGGADLPVVMLGNDLQIRLFTPQAEKILRLLPTDVGRPIGDCRPKIDIPDLVDLCREVIDTLVPRRREVVVSGDRPYSMWVRPYRTADNRVDGVALALLDAGERRTGPEARYKHLFETANDGIVVADAESGEILEVNPSVIRLFGFPRARLAGAKFWESELFQGSGIDEGVRAELRSRESVVINMLPALSGEPIPVEINASPYWEGDRRVIQFNIRDISARRRAEEQLHRAHEELREHQKMEAVGRLAGSVAHDFNNILTTVVGYTDLLRNQLKDDPSIMQMLDQVRTGSQRAVALTRKLLAFGRKQIISPAVLDVNQVIADIQQMLTVMMSKGVELQVKLQPKLGCVRGDRTQLEQVVINLVLNARDAMPDGGSLTVETFAVEADQEFSASHPTVPPGRYIAITVKDTGTGMDEKTQAHMFEPFFTTKTKGRGVGLGLSTVYNIVQQSGGSLSAVSEPGVGTTFTVYLPRVDAEPSRSKRMEAANCQGSETILLVDDEYPIRQLVRRFLEARGYKVLEAGSGPDALRTSREYTEPVQLMITDVVMPRMSGRELALQLAPERPDMRVLYISGHSEEAIAHHGVLNPGVELLQKPFSQHDLLSKVREILDRKLR